MSKEGTDGYPTTGDVPLLAKVMGGQFVLIVPPEVRITYGEGPLLGAIPHAWSEDGAGHRSDHNEAVQSWRQFLSLAQELTSLVDSGAQELACTSMPPAPTGAADTFGSPPSPPRQDIHDPIETRSAHDPPFTSDAVDISAEGGLYRPVIPAADTTSSDFSETFVASVGAADAM